jgi:hypothetical protein
VRQKVVGEPPKPTYNVAPKRAEIGRCIVHNAALRVARSEFPNWQVGFKANGLSAP